MPERKNKLLATGDLVPATPTIGHADPASDRPVAGRRHASLENGPAAARPVFVLQTGEPDPVAGHAPPIRPRIWPWPGAP